MTSPSSVPSPVYIYALVDPRTDEIRYVGQTVDLDARLRLHLAPSSKKVVTYKNRWLNKLDALGLRPVMRVLETADTTSWPEVERRWIANLREEGCQLTNLTDGGEGTPGGGWSLSDETKTRMSAAQKGKIVSIETRRKLSVSNVGKQREKKPWNTGLHLTEEHRQKISVGGKGIRKPPGFGAKISAARTGVKRGPLPEATKAKISAATKGVKKGPYSDEWRANISAGKRRANALKKQQKDMEA